MYEFPILMNVYVLEDLIRWTFFAVQQAWSNISPKMKTFITSWAWPILISLLQLNAAFIYSHIHTGLFAIESDKEEGRKWAAEAAYSVVSVNQSKDWVHNILNLCEWPVCLIRQKNIRNSLIDFSNLANIFGKKICDSLCIVSVTVVTENLALLQ